MKKHHWTAEEIEKLKNLSHTKSNPEIAAYFGITPKAAERAMARYGIKRDKKLISKILSNTGKKNHEKYNYFGENNPFWKGGISKNKYHYKKLQMQRYPERVKARRLVYIEIKAGRLKRGKCEICKKLNAEAHHNDYSKPLEIRWFYKKHHREYHNTLCILILFSFILISMK